MTGKGVAMILAAWLCAGLALDAAPSSSWARSHEPRAPSLRSLGIKSPRARPYRSRSLTIHRADGTVVRGYRDTYGTHLRDSNGRTTNCRRNKSSLAGVDLTCR